MTPTSQYRQRGVLLPQLLILLLALSLLAYAESRDFMRKSNEALAVATGNYMLEVRGAVLKGLSTYEAVLAKVDTSKAPTGTYPTPPAWTQFTGDEQTVQVRDLKTSGLLPNDFPERMPLGRSAYVRLLRTPGICPGVGCEVRAFVVSCWPITAPLPRGAVDGTTCPPAPANLKADYHLVSTVMSSTQGFGGTNLRDANRVAGTLMRIDRDVLGIANATTGHLVVAASLNATSFNQFVRQGDVRKIYLNNTLDVAGSIATDTGLLLRTAVDKGTACTQDGLFATSLKNNLAQCRSGQWFELAPYIVTAMKTLANGAAVPTATCPTDGMEPFAVASLSTEDVTMTGDNVKVRGTVQGTSNMVGAVDRNGVINATGPVNGTVTSTPDSAVRVVQGVDVSSGTVQISDANPGARALVITGCRRND